MDVLQSNALYRKEITLVSERAPGSTGAAAAGGGAGVGFTEATGLEDMGCVGTGGTGGGVVGIGPAALLGGGGGGGGGGAAAAGGGGGGGAAGSAAGFAAAGLGGASPKKIQLHDMYYVILYHRNQPDFVLARF